MARAAGKSFASECWTICVISAGISFETTEMMPRPPSAIRGIVIASSPESTINSGVPAGAKSLAITNPDQAIRSGMTATVRIVIGQHENVLTVPNRAIQVSGGQRMVTVLFEGQQIQVPVTVGLTNDTTSEVTSNQLKEGDEVIINSSVAAPSNAGAGAARGFFGGLGR